MKNFVVILVLYVSVLLNFANGRPDLSLGYRYNKGHSSSGDEFLQAPVAVSPSSYTPTASGNSYFGNQPSVRQLGFGVNENSFNGRNKIYTGGVDQNNFNAGVGINTHYTSGSYSKNHQEVQQGDQAATVTKHFYVYRASSDDDQQQIERHIQIGQPQKNYRVVFIDTPSSPATKAKIVADLAPTEEKTAIYVFSKQSDALDIETAVNTQAPVSNKPEVFFVNYKTPEEAVHAQHTIQAQYDALGGSSDISNEGAVSVTSVIGTLDHHSNDIVDINQSASSNVGLTSADSTNAVEIRHTGTSKQQKTYLPPAYSYKS